MVAAQKEMEKKNILLEKEQVLAPVRGDSALERQPPGKAFDPEGAPSHGAASSSNAAAAAEEPRTAIGARTADQSWLAHQGFLTSPNS